MQDINMVLAAMEQAEREAAGLMLDAKKIIAENKTGARDVVTEYDKRVQALLIERLGAAVPGAEFFAEELSAQGGAYAEKLFIIDPIDGTMNFVKGFNHSCISVAYAENGVVLAAAVYNPYQGELFTARKGGGAALNGTPIHAPNLPLGEVVALFGTSPYRTDLKAKTFRLAEEVFSRSLDIRRQGSAELDLCSVAAGRAGLYFELNLSYWDYAAGALIATEAGCVCLTPEGNALPSDGSKAQLAAGSPKAVAEFLELAAGIL